MRPSLPKTLLEKPCPLYHFVGIVEEDTLAGIDIICKSVNVGLYRFAILAEPGILNVRMST